MTLSKTQKADLEEITYLMDQALDEINSVGSGTRGFAEKMRTYLIKRHEDVAPGQPIALRTGRSLLVGMAQDRTLNEAMAYAQSHQQRAWVAGHHYQYHYPLAQILSSMKSMYCRDDKNWRWPDVANKNPQAFKDFLQQGFEYAMPSTLLVDPKNELDGSVAQWKVVQFCQNDDPLMRAQEKLTWLKTHGGELVINLDDYKATNAWHEWIQAGLLDADTNVAVIEHRHITRMPWPQAWLKKIDHSSTREILDHLQSMNVDTTPIELKRLEILLPDQQKWSDIQMLLNQTPGGWNHEDAHGNLLWHTVLARKPRLLEDICLERKPRLKATGSNGRSIWQHIVEGWFSVKAQSGAMGWHDNPLPNQSALKETLNKVDFTFDTQGILFVLRKDSPNLSDTTYRLEELFKLTFSASPTSWVGEPDELQANKASYILQGLLVGQGTNAAQREALAAQAVLLHRAWEQTPESFTPATTAVLWTLGQYLRQAPLKLNTDTSVLSTDTSIPTPAPGSMDWAQGLIGSQRKKHATSDLMDAILKRAYLGAVSQTHTRPEDKSTPSM